MLGKRITRRGMLKGVLGLAGMAILGACAPKDTQETTSDEGTEVEVSAPESAVPAADEKITLTWFNSNMGESQYEPVWKATIAEFEEQNPNIKIEPVIVARKDEWVKFVAAAKAGQAYDICKEALPEAAYNGYLMPLDDYWAASPDEYHQAWPQGMLNAGKFRGTLYGLCTWGGTYAMMYNTDLVEKAGLDMASPPETWDEYISWADALTEGDQYATAILGGPTNTTTRILLPTIWSNGGEAYNEDVTEFTFAKDPKSLEAIEWYLDLHLKHGFAAPSPATTNYLEQTTLFAQEKIASMHNCLWARAKVVGDNPALEGKIEVAFLPMNTSSKVTLSSMGCDEISKDCKHPDDAWSFILFNNNREFSIQRAIVSDWMPARSDVVDDPRVADDPMLQKFIEYGNYARAYPFACPIVEEISANLVPQAVQAVLLGEGTAKDVFSKLDEELTARVQEL